MGVSLPGKIRGNGLKLHQRMFRLDLRKKFLLRKSGEALEQTAQRGGGITIPGGFKRCVNVALRDMVSGDDGGDGSKVGLDDLSGLFQP